MAKTTKRNRVNFLIFSCDIQMTIQRSMLFLLNLKYTSLIPNKDDFFSLLWLTLSFTIESWLRFSITYSNMISQSSLLISKIELSFSVRIKLWRSSKMFSSMSCLIVDPKQISSHSIINKLKVKYYSKENLEIWYWRKKRISVWIRFKES